VRGTLLECISIKGERKMLLSSAAPVHNADGVIVGAVVAELDITERRAVEQAQLDAERRFRQVLEALPQLVWTCTSRGEADYFSRQWLEYTGLTLEQSVGHGWTAVVHPDDRFEFVECWQRAVREGDVFDAEVRLLGIDETYRWFKQKATPLRHADGSVSKWFGTSTDITDIIAAREKIRSANVLLERKVAARTRALEEANAELQTFAHSAAHDLRAPLRNIHGFATVLIQEETSNLSERGGTYLRRIMDGVVRLDELIMDLLSYSQLARTEIQLQRVDLAELVPEIIGGLSSEIEARHANVIVENDLPAVLAERMMLGQVISNLITNALKFVPQNVQPQVRIASSVKGGKAKLMVTDNGIGVAPEFRARIFNVFERLHRQEEYPGTGIGLAIVRRGIERMGGSVTLESEVGKGSTFEIELPACGDDLKSQASAQ
jgi:PAS domain S-box-containing protein